MLGLPRQVGQLEGLSRNPSHHLIDVHATSNGELSKHIGIYEGTRYWRFTVSIRASDSLYVHSRLP